MVELRAENAFEATCLLRGVATTSQTKIFLVLVSPSFRLTTRVVDNLARELGATPEERTADMIGYTYQNVLLTGLPESSRKKMQQWMRNDMVLVDCKGE